MWGHKRKVWGTSKNFRPALRAGIVPPPTCKLLPTPLDLEIRVRGHSRSLKAVPFDRLDMVSY